MISTFRRAGVVVRVLVVLILLAVMGGVTAWLVISSGPMSGGGSRVDNAVDWAARRVVEIVERSIVPAVGFERFEYESPRTLRFIGLTLTAPDGTRVVESERVEVELTEIPKVGQQILIERIAVRRGLVELIETRTPEAKMGFAGLAPFVRERPGASAEEDEPAAPRQGFEAEPRLSDVLQIRLVTLDDCGLRYTPLSGEPPMRLMGVTTEMRITPEDEGGNRWHGFDVSLARGTAMRAALAGRVDLDRFVVELAPSTVRVDLNQGAAEELPPAVQSVLAEHDARGGLTLGVSGTVPMRDLPGADASVRVGLKDFNLAFGEYRLPIATATIDAALADGVATVPRGFLGMLGGEVLVSASAEVFEEGMPVRAQWDISGVRLRELLRGGTPAGETPKLAGIVRASGTATTRLSDATGALRGEGAIDVLQGRFAQIEFLNDLFRSITGGGGDAEASTSSELHGVFALRGAAADFSAVTLKTPVLSARGNGVLWFDGRLDFIFNGGPLERVQELLGDFGRIFGEVTDRFIKYSVKGTVGEPKVGVLPFGVGGAPDRSELP